MTKTINFVTIIIGDTMNTRKLAYLFLSISLVMIVAGSFSSFLIGLREDHQEVLRRMEDVGGIFEGFSTNTTLFEDYRDELYTEVLGNVYYDTMYKSDETVKGKLNEYEAIVDSIKKDTKKLDSLCKKVYYPDNEVNKMCINYKSIYEQVVNYYVTDIHTYNDNVEKYNAYQDTIKKDLKIRKYHTDYDYIDYNGDKIFDGKEE